MMLPVTGPTTSLMEDMDILGLGESKDTPATKIKQTKKSDAEGGDYAGPPGDKTPGDPGGDVDLKGDAAAGHYTYVPVRGDENVAPDGKYGKKRGGAKNEDIESVNNKMIPSFMVPSAAEVQEQDEKLAEQADKDQLSKAWDVVNSYFSEDNDGLNADGLRGVLNAMGFALNVAVEDIALLQGENSRLTEAVNDLNQILKEGEDEDDKADDKADDDDDDDDDADADDADADDDDAPKGKGKKLPWMESKSARANLQEDASLNSILDEVASIGGSPKKQAINAQSKLIEGFENAVSSASDLVERIVTVIRKDEGLAEGEEIDLPEGDKRVDVAKFFYSIAEDAQGYLTRLVEGDVSFRVAEEDLNRLLGDINKGVEALHHIA